MRIQRFLAYQSGVYFLVEFRPTELSVIECRDDQSPHHTSFMMVGCIAHPFGEQDIHFGVHENRIIIAAADTPAHELQISFSRERCWLREIRQRKREFPC